MSTLTGAMLRALVTIAPRGARGVERTAGTIHPDARPEYTAGDVRLHGGTVRALLSRGLLSGTVRPAALWAAAEVTDYALTDAGWTALASEYGRACRQGEDAPADTDAPAASTPELPRAYPMPAPEHDSRFTFGLTFDVAAVLEQAGYPPVASGADFLELQMALFRFLYAHGEAA
ncbi:hypothetical protein [Parafrankia sp. BMG5.11]|uniref:hypothetical protein n=1 Tax=Parafrankia sp. BMG5.11 TaxID=222540 RepID=UPI00103C69B5|nr:hypothetical protein [Parafrankia sp. BMG5.11]TCJ40706.1 hypothetical protein E0504_03770 [Parafrankia sp. BMG5.11]